MVEQTEQLEFPDLKYSLFLGCVIPNRYPMIERATRTVFEKLKIELQDMEGASCCPAPGVFRSVDRATWLSLGARNITIAEQDKNELLTLCNGCFGTLLEVDHSLKSDPKLKEAINDVLKPTGRQFEGTSKVRQIVDMLYFDIGLENLKKLVKHKLGINVAIHYGCHLLKPSYVRPFGDEVDNPRFFDEVVEAIGCNSIDYESKQLCCGAGGAVRTGMKKTSLEFTLEKIRNVDRVGADCIVVSCPFCFLQYDLGQIEIRDMLNQDEEPYNIPVIFITQLLGLAMGIPPEELGLVKPPGLKGVSPFISTQPILDIVKERSVSK